MARRWRKCPAPSSIPMTRRSSPSPDRTASKSSPCSSLAARPRIDAERNPPQRFRHELRRASVARPVDASGRSRRHLQHAGILDGPRPHAGARQVRRAVPGRRAGHLRRLQRLSSHRAGACRAGAGQRPADADLRDGRGDRTSGLRRHLRIVLRTSLPVRSAHEHAGPPDQGPDRLEHRHRLPRQRGARHGDAEAGRPRRSLRRGRGLHAGHLQTVGGELGGRRRAARPAGPALRRSQQDPPHPARGPALQGRRDPSLRAVAAAHAGAVPGRRLQARPRFRRASRRVRVHQRPVEEGHRRHRRRPAPPRRRGRPGSDATWSSSP